MVATQILGRIFTFEFEGGGGERICGCLIKQEATANAVGEDLVSKIGGGGKIKNPFQLRFEKRRGIDFKNFF